jgi:drug/metabolite transporter (DMT)-like permease
MSSPTVARSPLPPSHATTVLYSPTGASEPPTCAMPASPVATPPFSTSTSPSLSKASPLTPRTPPRALYSHIALAASQVIFAASMTIVRSAFINSNEVSPIIIVAARLLLSLAAFTAIHYSRMYRRRRVGTCAAVSPATVTSETSVVDGTRRKAPTMNQSHNESFANYPNYHVSVPEEEMPTASPSSSSDINDTAVASADEFHDLSRNMKLRCVALGIAGGTINMLCASTGVKYANAITSGAFQCAIPPLTCFMAFLFCRETLSIPKILALVFAVIGNMVMVQVWCVFTVSEACGNTNSQEEASSSLYYIGCLFLLTNVTAYSAYLVFQRPVVKLLPKCEFLFRTYLYGFVGMLIVVLCRIDLVWHQLTTPGIITREVLLAIGFAGLVNSTFAYYLVSVGIAGVSPAAAAIYFCLQPLFVCLFSTVFLGEDITLVQAGGGVLIIAGLLMSAAPNMPNPTKCCNRSRHANMRDDGSVDAEHCDDILRIGGPLSGIRKEDVLRKPLTSESPRNNEENVELGTAVVMTTTVEGVGCHALDEEDETHHFHHDGAVSYASGSLST